MGEGEDKLACTLGSPLQFSEVKLLSLEMHASLSVRNQLTRHLLRQMAADHTLFKIRG